MNKRYRKEMKYNMVISEYWILLVITTFTRLETTWKVMLKHCTSFKLAPIALIFLIQIFIHHLQGWSSLEYSIDRQMGEKLHQRIHYIQAGWTYIFIYFQPLAKDHSSLFHLSSHSQRMELRLNHDIGFLNLIDAFRRLK